MEPTNLPCTLPPFDADQPLNAPEQDLLDRAAFATGIARRIAALPRRECYVIGLHGRWGEGKTSVLRLVDAALRDMPDTVSVWYNPWRYATEEAMLHGFFRTIASCADVRVRSLLEALSPAISIAGKIGGRWYGWIEDLTSLVVAKGERTVEAIHQSLCERLEKSKKRTVVLVDDIDRLEDHEVLMLLRIIKACADLPNVVYLLAFDREQVAASLSRQGLDGTVDAGRRYLEKIIQIPLSLPSADPAVLARICKHRISDILDRAGVRLNEEDSSEWERCFSGGIGVRLQTPRHIQQYVNAVNFAVPMLQGEVHVVDLLLVEALRVFYPAAYEVVGQRLDEFVAQAPRFAHLWTTRSEKPEALAAVKAGMDARSIAGLDALIGQLFPLYDVNRQGVSISVSYEPNWARQRRVCSPAYARRYFSYAVSRADVSDRAITAIIEEANLSDSPRLLTLLEAETDAEKMPILIEKLVLQMEGLDDATGAKRVAKALATLSRLVSPPFSLRQGLHPGIRAAQLAADLCARLPEGVDRLAGVRQVLGAASTMWFAGAFMLSIDPPTKVRRRVGHPNVLTEDQLADVRNDFSTRVGAFWLEGESPFDLSSRWRFEILAPWARAAGRQPVWDRFISGIRMNGGIALRIVRCLTITDPSAAGCGGEYQEMGPAHLEELNSMVDVDALYQLLLDTWISAERRKPPGEWRSLNPDDRLFAEFWWAYRLWKPETLVTEPPAADSAAPRPNGSISASTPPSIESLLEAKPG